MPPVIATATTFLTNLGIGAALASTIVTAVGQLAVGAAISLVSSALTRRATPDREDLKRQLSTPTERPPYRYVYGETRAVGSLVAWPVKGDILWGCWLLNSRASDMSNLGIILDEREMTHTGDPFDFTDLDGATATNDPFVGHVNFWVQRGGETSPPQRFLNDCAYDAVNFTEGYKSTDGWQGRTVLWMRLDAGDSDNRAERWPGVPPLVQVDAKWSEIYDPRNVAHDINDPSTWEPSDNQGLILLDVLLNNPVRSYQVLNLDMESYEWAADVADEDVALKAGGTEKRYRAAGTVVFSEGVELEDMLDPILIAGASRMTRSAGKLSVIPATTRATVDTITEAIDNIKVDWLRPSKELPTRILGNYVNVDRGYENADLPYYEIPGAQAADGGVGKTQSFTMSMVESASQAQRLVKIFAYDARRQRKITTTLPPENINLIPGSEATVAFPVEYSAINGTYEVIQIVPKVDVSDSGVTLRSQVELLIADDTGLSWDAATEEKDVTNESFDVSIANIGAPGAITVTVEDFDTGGTVIPSAEFTFDPSASASVYLYEWQYEVDSGDWQSGGNIDASTVNGVGDIIGRLNSIATTSIYRIRVRAISIDGRVSDWSTSSSFSVAFDLTISSAVGTFARVELTGTAPSAANFAGIRLYSTDVGVAFSGSAAVEGYLAMDPSTAFDVSFGDADAVNEISNGDFSSGSTGWTLGAGWSIGSGVASHAVAASSQNITTNITVDDGEDYRFTYTRSNSNGFATLARINLTSSPTITSDGVHTGVITAPSGSSTFSIVANLNMTGDVDDIYLVKDTVDALSLGERDFWIVPVTTTGAEGLPAGPYTLRIY